MNFGFPSILACLFFRVFSKIDACSKYRDRSAKAEGSKSDLTKSEQSTMENIDLENGVINEGYENDKDNSFKSS